MGRLRRRPLGQIVGRALQRMRGRMESWGFGTSDKLPNLSDDVGRGSNDPSRILEGFRAGPGWPRPFASLEAPSETGRVARERWPTPAEETLATAERLMEERFDLLGFRDLHFGRPLDWHLDPLTGVRAPRSHWSKVPALAADLKGDPKLIWELNRHQWFVTLGRAYQASSDERFAAAFARSLASWMEENPPKIGINWTSSLEVGLRTISWIWALHLFRDSPRLTPELFLKAIQHLALNGRHVETQLSTYFSPNTHLTGEALGLVYLGTLLPRLPGSERWLRTGLRILVSELDQQVHADGVYFEHTTWYHRYTTDFYLHLLILSRRHGLGVEEVVENRLEVMLDHLMWLIRPDGSAPLVGDDDGGRLLFLDHRPPDDFRSTLGTGAALFRRDDWAHVAGGATEETLWLLGTEGLVAYESLEPRPPNGTSRGFEEGGFFTMRDGWARHSSHLLVRCGSPGRLSGHTHADALSFDLTVGGESFLVDPGTGSYADLELRNRLRGTASHNALTLGGTPFALPPPEPFSWNVRERCTVDTWCSSPRFTFLQGRHDGFRRRGLAGDHIRSVLHLKGDYWVVRDRVAGEASEEPVLHFHFAPGIELDAVGKGLVARRPGPGGDELRLQVLPFGVREVTIGSGESSPLYGKILRGPLAEAMALPGRDREIVTFLIPGTSKACELEESEGHTSWNLIDGNIRDLLMLGGAASGSIQGVASDFEWLWGRWTQPDDLPEELVLVSGTWLEIGGREVVRTREAIPWLTLRFSSKEMQVDGPAGTGMHLRPPDGEPIRLNGSQVATSDGVFLIAGTGSEGRRCSHEPGL